MTYSFSFPYPNLFSENLANSNDTLYAKLRVEKYTKGNNDANQNEEKIEADNMLVDQISSSSIVSHLTSDSKDSKFDNTSISSLNSYLNICKRDTERKCASVGCSIRKGTADCIQNKCMCKAGYCANELSNFIGCEHLTLEVHNVDEQKLKAGVYSVVHVFMFHNRPVWKQEEGESWLWFCPKFSCWIFSSISPNYQNCEAGIVSQQTISLTPFESSNISSWKFWNENEWNDDQQKNTIKLRCQDRGGEEI